MANLDLSGFVDDLKGQIVLAWPEIPETSIEEIEHLELVAWEDLAPPYVLIACADFQRGDWGMSNLAFEFPVEIYRVELASGGSSGLRLKLEQLIDRLWPSEGLTKGQVLSIPTWGTGRNLEPNRSFIASGSQRRAGVVRLQCLVGRQVT